MFKRLEEQINLIHKQGSVADPCEKAVELNVLVKDDRGGKIPLFYDVEWARESAELIIEPRESKSKDKMNKAFKSSGINGMDYEMLGTMINPSEASSIFDSYIDYILTDLGNKSPFYVNLLDDCIWEETDDSHPVNTLAVSWDKTNKKFRLYYNPSFILKGALAQYLYAKQDYLSLEDCYVYMTKFYLVHEMSHITRSHMFTQESDLLKDVSPQDVNIYGDSFINQTIPELVLKEKKKVPPVIGIINEISKKGVLKVDNTMSLQEKLLLCLKSFTNVNVYSYYTSSDYDLEDKEALVIFRMGDILTNSKMGQGNSGLFIKAIHKFFNEILGPQSQNMNYDSSQDNGDTEDSQDSQAQQSDGGSNSGGQGDNSQDSQGNNSQDKENSPQNDATGNTGQGDGSNQDSQDKEGNTEDKGQQDSKGGSSQDNTEQGDTQEDNLKNPKGKSKGDIDNSNKSKGKSDSIPDTDFENADFDDIVSQLQQQNNASQKDKMKTEDNAEENENGEPKPKEPLKDEDILKQLSKEEKKAVKDLVNSAIKKDASENLTSMFGEEGYSKITGKRVNVESKSAWRKALSKAVSQTLGIKEEWDSNAVNARIEGELGREVEKPNLKSILIMIDCSGSMGPGTFKKVLQEVIILEKLFKDKPTVHVVFWGSTSYHKKYKLDKNLFKRVMSDASNLGGTNYIAALPFAQSKVKNPDLVIDCTDFKYTLDEDTIKSRKKWNKKTVWVAAPHSRYEVLKKLDPAYARRVIKLK